MYIVLFTSNFSCHHDIAIVRHLQIFIKQNLIFFLRAVLLMFLWLCKRKNCVGTEVESRKAFPRGESAAFLFRSGPPATLRPSAPQNRRPLAAPGCQLVPQPERLRVPLPAPFVPATMLVPVRLGLHKWADAPNGPVPAERQDRRAPRAPLRSLRRLCEARRFWSVFLTWRLFFKTNAVHVSPYAACCSARFFTFPHARSHGAVYSRRRRAWATPANLAIR